MKANELRIGNWVNFTFSDINADVMICHNDLRNFEQNIKMGRFNNIYKPIQLTEEWLIKFGFKRLSKDWQKNGIIIHTRKRGYVLRKSVPIIKYVHQLQNLYFALRGDELNVIVWHDN